MGRLWWRSVLSWSAGPITTLFFYASAHILVGCFLGVAAAETVQGVQSVGVIACAKHFVGNEQEHFRGGSGGGENSTSYSSDIDDRTLHELYVSDPFFLIFLSLFG